MSIHRLDIPEGAPLPRRQELLRPTLEQILITRGAGLVELDPGSHDVTPDSWIRPTHRHEVTVFDSGEGLYRLYPTDEAVGVAEASEEEGIHAVNPGGAQQPVNAENPLTVVAGPHPVTRTLSAFGLIAYVAPRS